MRLLIVEDETRLARSLAAGLTADGFDADVEHDGTRGLRRAVEQPYDLVILDVMLPGTNGYDVVTSLRAMGLDVPVLMLTAKDGEYDEAEGLDSGADDYLTKPFSYVVLLARVRALLRRARAGRADLRVGDLVVSPGSRRVTAAGRPVPLTAKEFTVLELLAARAGDVVPKREILEHAWDLAYDGDVNIVEVYVSALRRKIGPDRIETVRGAGYRLVDAGDAGDAGGTGA
ncbi:response regulator transcription factor [Myceligenerans crystallogenes]|uniref:Response regulator transcription factor n=1 Tax=Myceligenerans crystallogenes TaxID=316335 RepID=A0ABN2NMC1_9MICO